MARVPEFFRYPRHDYERGSKKKVSHSLNTYTTGPETPRLRHRAFTVEDAEAFFALNGNPQVMRYTGEPPLESVGAARAAIEAYPDFEERGFGRWACVLKETGSVIGFCGLKYLPELDEVDVGYRLLPEYWGRGLATEACRASLEFGSHILRLDHIIGLVLPENHASIRVLEKAGMQSDGRMSYLGTTVLRYALHQVSTSDPRNG